MIILFILKILPNLKQYQKDEALLKGFVTERDDIKLKNYENILKKLNNYLKTKEKNLKINYN